MIDYVELAQLFQLSGMVHFDVTLVMGASVDDLGMERVQAYLLRFKRLDILALQEQARSGILVNTDIVRYMEDQEGPADRSTAPLRGKPGRTIAGCPLLLRWRKSRSRRLPCGTRCCSATWRTLP